MDGKVLVQFVEDGSDENPFVPRRWRQVPRVGDTVLLHETERIYRVLGVRWSSVQRADGSYDDTEPLVTVRVAV